MNNQLSKFPLFDTLNEKELSLCEEQMKKKLYKKDEYIIRQGDTETDVYIITQGAVGVFKTKEGSLQEHQLATLSSGEIFGELALIDKAPRSTSIKALEETKLMHLSETNISKLIQHHSI